MTPDYKTVSGPGALMVDEIGAGPPIVFVHGQGASGAEAWRAQWPLAARWRLVFPHRPGFGGSPQAEGEDLDAEAGIIAELLGQGAHLVGQADGGLVALLAAGQRPRAVWSLLAIEPPAVSAARGDPDVEAFAQASRGLHPAWEAAIPIDVLMAATFPKLFVSTGHNPALETICDTLALQLGGDRKLLRGAGHPPQSLGERLNAVVEAFAKAQPLPK